MAQLLVPAGKESDVAGPVDAVLKYRLDEDGRPTIEYEFMEDEAVPSGLVAVGDAPARGGRSRLGVELAKRVRDGIRDAGSRLAARRIGRLGASFWNGRHILAAGQLEEARFLDIATASAGHCDTMGTASTMNAIAEALVMSLTGFTAIPAPYRERGQVAYETGVRTVASGANTGHCVIG